MANTHANKYNAGDQVKIVYDKTGCEGVIGPYVDQITEAFGLYGGNVKTISQEDLQAWSTDGAQNDGSDSGQIIFIASAETEEFHSKVRKQLIPLYTRSFLVLVYPEDQEKQVDRIINSVKKQLIKSAPAFENKNLDKENVNAAVEKWIVKIPDIHFVSDWWPRILMQVCTQSSSRSCLTVYYKIDEDDEGQLYWFHRQKAIMDSEFHVSCLSQDGVGLLDEEEYIENSNCVVIYVNTKKFQNDEQYRLDVLETIKTVIDKCKDDNTVTQALQVYMNEEGVDLNAELEKNVETNAEEVKDLKMVGNEGMVQYWIGLLSLLKIIKVKRKPDSMFHSDYTDSVEVSRFDPSRYPDIFGGEQQSAPPAREVTQSNIFAEVRNIRTPNNPTILSSVPPAMQGLTYQYSKGGVKMISSSDAEPRRNCLCMPWRFPL